ncbi:WD repeat, SAM and U-box domain-containing protein 1-like isoform X1 [Anguilla anguilla]|uniref:WD repeat, SAM and U-box domain-containing protein 1-like isoform X1 n=1 Tax=Anguilla anguilla TaxID=7936 RepID=UPI0015AEF9F9|nr:WD repeat, SAM and U-box domain-containing protein 1-like isoform X1 [Anguilla anguilla]
MVSLICTLQHHTADVNWCAFSRNLLATCSSDKTIRIFSSLDFSELPFSPLTGHGYAVHCCCFTPCGQFLASCSTDGTMIVWSMGTGEMVAAFDHPGRSPVRVCALSADSSYLVSGASDGTFALWDFSSRTLRRTGIVDEASLVACSVSPCGQIFVTGSTNGDLRIWNLEAKQLHAERNAHDLGVTCCHFSSQIHIEGEVVTVRLASCGQDSLLKIWTVSQLTPAGCTMQLVHTLTAQSAPVLSCSFSSDGRLLVSSSVDKTVTVYNASQGDLLHTLNQHERYVAACAFSPGASLMATGSMDRTVNVWRLGDRVIEGGDGGESLAAETTNASWKGKDRPGGHTRLLVRDWSEEDVQAWLREEGLEALAGTFRNNDIDGAELLALTKESLAAELKIDSVGLRNKLIRKIEELKATLVCTDGPDEYLCPITREVMKDPVIAADGYSYEREAIQCWIDSKNRSSPMTNLPLQTTMLTPNRTLKMAIDRWRSSRS